ETLWRDLIARQTRTLGPLHQQTLYSTVVFANYLLLAKRRDEAAALIPGAVDGMVAALGPDHQRSLLGKGVLARLYLHQQKFHEAAAAYGEVHRAWAAKYGEKNEVAVVTLLNVGVAERYAGDGTDAEAAYREALATGGPLFGDQNPVVQSIKYYLADRLLD